MVKVIVSGLAPEEHFFRESLTEQGVAIAEKLEKTIKFSPEDNLFLQVKSRVEGNKKRFEVHARITVQGRVYAAKEPDNPKHREVWDLHLTTKQALRELKKVVEKSETRFHVKGLTEDEALEKRRGFGNV
ncbi:hypothetical protein HY571_01120 [Candidatus Micrarchaeota archaeon]|nr:hypothetical protein [Candidatus Micrarchaeota archaeon]